MKKGRIPPQNPKKLICVLYIKKIKPILRPLSCLFCLLLDYFHENYMQVLLFYYLVNFVTKGISVSLQ